MREIFRIIPVSFPCFSEFILYAHSYLWALFKSLTVPSLTIYLLANWRLFHKHNKLFVNHRWSLNAWKKKFSSKRLLPHQSRYAILHSACHCRNSIPSGPSATQFLFAVTRQARTYIWRIVMQSQLKSSNSGKQKVALYAKGNLLLEQLS